MGLLVLLLMMISMGIISFVCASVNIEHVHYIALRDDCQVHFSVVEKSRWLRSVTTLIFQTVSVANHLDMNCDKRMGIVFYVRDTVVGRDDSARRKSLGCAPLFIAISTFFEYNFLDRESS